jgi:DNA-3-methyladenine glycosylase
MTKFYTKRIYDPADESDGYRVLVDRLWPRGVSKERAALDEWAKDIAPSTELRQWFGHVPERFEEFSEKYIDELKSKPVAQAVFDNWRTFNKVTILYAAKDEQHNEAKVLLRLLD